MARPSGTRGVQYVAPLMFDRVRYHISEDIYRITVCRRFNSCPGAIYSWRIQTRRHAPSVMVACGPVILDDSCIIGGPHRSHASASRTINVYGP